MSVTFASALDWAKKELGGAGATDDAAAMAAVERAKQQMATMNEAARLATVTEAAAQAEAAGPTLREDVETRKQALFDAVYLVAAADGAISVAERARLGTGLAGLLEGAIEPSAIDDALEKARVLFSEFGLDGAAKTVAAALPEIDAQSSLLVIASAVGWLGGGVGTKEGLALQALARAFSMPITTLHQLMAIGAKIK
jgi:hypothetical protein